MTGTFGGAYKVFSKGRKITTFRDLLDSYRRWGGVRAPMTDKQVKSLAEEVGYTKKGAPKTQRGRVATNVSVKGKNGKMMWRDVFTGERMKGEFDKSRVPHWRVNEVMIVKGTIHNVNTGEKLKMRSSRGSFIKRSKWTLTNSRGKVSYLYPKEKKIKVKKSSKKKRGKGER